MKRDNIETILKVEAPNRQFLAKLAAYAYQKGINDPKLGLDTDQATKYAQFQFTFNPKKDYEDYRDDFEAVFKEKAQFVFDQLKAQHPFGVEIWVYPNNAKQHPLIENNALLAVNSLISAAKWMLMDSSNQQKIDKIQSEEQINAKYSNVSKTIAKAKEEAVEIIKSLYTEKNLSLDHSYLKKSPFQKWVERLKYRVGLIKEDPTVSPEVSQYYKAEETVHSLQKLLVAQIASFNMSYNQLPSHKDYKNTYKVLSQYEQKQKLDQFYKDKGKELKHDVEGDSFKRDIFTVDTIVEGENQSIKSAKWHYHKRHYTLTDGQVDLKARTEGVEKGKINQYSPQSTATSHSPVTDFSLANSALVDEGDIDETGNVVINFTNGRHGSTSPNELYPESAKPRLSREEKHEATYRAFLNMEQHLQQLRTRTIEAFVTKIANQNEEKLLSPEEIAAFSRVLSYEITTLIINNNLFAGKEEFGEAFFIPLIENALDKTVSIDKKDAFKKKMIENLNANMRQNIINIKNIHTHLITAAGLGSSLQSQRYHFQDSRIAQYATWDESNSAGYVYMSNGVNSWRYDTTLFESRQLLSGTNSVAMVELYKELVKFDSAAPQDRVVDLFKQQTKLLENYNKSLKEVKSAAKNYISQLKTDYMPEKITVDRLEKTIEQQKQFLKKLKLASPEDKRIETTANKIKEDEDKLKTWKLNLKRLQKSSKDLRSVFRNAEKQLHSQAVVLNETLYEELKSKRDLIESLSEKPEERNRYLAQRAFLLAEELMNETKYGFAEWKIDGNNGIMQALVHLAAEQMGVFASGGCKSANDRELLLALLITEISSLVKDKDKKLTKHALQEAHKKAQDAFAWHISRRQTALDVSAIPKTGADILKYASMILKKYASEKDTTGFSQYGSHQKFETLAAHKRAGKGKDLVYDEMKKLSIKSSEGMEDFKLYKWWDMHSMEKVGLPEITSHLETTISPQALNVEEKISAFEKLQETIKNWSKGFFRNVSYDHTIKLLAWKIEERIFELNATNYATKNNLAITQTLQYKNLNLFLSNLSDKLKQNDIGKGEGLNQMKKIMEDYSKENLSIYTLSDIYMKLRLISESRVDDLKSRRAESRYFKFNADKDRPEWLRELYKELQKDINLLASKSEESLKIK